MAASELLRNGVVNSVLRNQPLVVPIFAASLHDADPGDDGDNATPSQVDCVENRSQITSATAVDGLGSSTGDPATWEVEEPATLTYLGTHDAISSGNWLGSAQISQPVTVADGDTVTLASFSLEVD